MGGLAVRAGLSLPPPVRASPAAGSSPGPQDVRKQRSTSCFAALGLEDAEASLLDAEASGSLLFPL